MTASNLESPLVSYVPGEVWLKRYPVRFAGMDISARLMLIRLRDGSLLAHSPCPIDVSLQTEVEAIGSLKHIVAPGTYHYFHVTAWQEAFPEATTWICPGVERKLPGLRFDWLLGAGVLPTWNASGFQGPYEYREMLARLWIGCGAARVELLRKLVHIEF